jgi:hypothetical protein
VGVVKLFVAQGTKVGDGRQHLHAAVWGRNLQLVLFSPSFSSHFGVFCSLCTDVGICTLKFGVSEKETLSPFCEHLVDQKTDAFLLFS